MPNIYTSTTPQAGDTIASTQPLILDNFGYLKASLGVDHNFTDNTATSQDGYHKVVHFVKQGSNPSAIASVGQLYTKDYNDGISVTDTQLFYRTGFGGTSQLTGNNTSPKGYCWMGGILIQWGSIATSGSSPSAIESFKISFPNKLMSISTNAYYNFTVGPPSTGSVPSNGESYIYINNDLVSASSFGWQLRTASASSVKGFYWMAIGN